MNGLLGIEKILADYGARQFNPPVKRARSAKGEGSAKAQLSAGMVAGMGAGQGAAPGSTFNPIQGAADTRRRLTEIVNRTPQVMVKITGSAKSVQHLIASLDYISRNGKIELETDLDHRLASKEDNRDLATLWAAAAHGTMPQELEPGQPGTRHTLNIVLSMPYGTDREGLQNAARDFAEHHFADNHPYVMAAHVDDSNPLHRDASSKSIKAGKPLNPHVHLIVLMRGRNGKRLNPRKADLQQWREVFAHKLRDRGINAAASNRQVRGAGRGRPAPVVAMHERGIQPSFWQAPSLEGNPFAQKAAETQETIAENYMRMAQALRASDSPTDKTLATALITRYAVTAQRGLIRKGLIHGQQNSKYGNEQRNERGNEPGEGRNDHSNAQSENRNPTGQTAREPERSRTEQQYRSGWRFAAVHQSGLRELTRSQVTQSGTGLRDVSSLGVVRDQTVHSQKLLSKDARRDLGR
jgi:hypothetical protein